MKSCARCGECCKWLGMKMMGMSPEIIDYLIKRGLEVDGDYILIPHTCIHLNYIVEDGNPIASCDIHNTDEYPIICRRFHGHGRYYIPTGCVYSTPDAEKEEKMRVELNNLYLKHKGRKK